MPTTLSRHGVAVKLIILALLLAPALAFWGSGTNLQVNYLLDRDSYGIDPLGYGNGRGPCDDEIQGVATSNMGQAGATETDPCPPEASINMGGPAIVPDDPCNDDPCFLPSNPTGDASGPSGHGGGATQGGIPSVPDLWKEPVAPTAAVLAPNRAQNLDSPVVSAITGEMSWREVDLQLSSLGPDFILTRSFYSGLKDYNGVFGPGWESSLRRHVRVIQKDGNNDPSEIVVAHGGNPTERLANPYVVSSKTWFKNKTESAFYQFDDTNAQFVRFGRSGETWTYTELQANEDIYYLTAISDPFGNTLTYSYLEATDPVFNQVSFPTDWVLDHVVDPEGRLIEVDWRTDYPLVNSVTVFSAASGGIQLQQVNYEYPISSGKFELSRVVGPKIWTEDKTTGAGVWEDFVREYEYDNASGTRLTKVIDGDGAALVETTYVVGDYKVETVSRGDDATQGVATYQYNVLDTAESKYFNRYTSPLGNEKRFYLDSGRIAFVKEGLEVDANGDTVSWRRTDYEYDLTCGCDRISKVTYPDGMVQEYHYSSAGRLESVWTGADQGGGAWSWRVERFEWSTFDPPTGQYFLRMIAREAVRNADDQELPGDACEDPNCGGNDPASGHVRYDYTYLPTNGQLEYVTYGDVQVEAGPPVYQSRADYFTWHANGMLATLERRLDGVAISRETRVLGTGPEARMMVEHKVEDLLNSESWNTTFTYTPLRLKETETHPDGSKTKYEWDERSGLVAVHENYSGGSGERTTEYRSNRRGLPWRQYVRDIPSGAAAFQVTEFSYDSASQLIKIERSGLGGAMEALGEFKYDRDGYLIERHVWEGQAATVGPLVYKYDYGDAENGGAHLLSAVTRNWGPNGLGGFNKSEDVWRAGDGSTSLIASYDEMGRPVVWRDALGLLKYQTYDDFGRLRRQYREVDAGTFSVSEYKYNSRGYVREVVVGGITGTPTSPSSIWWDQHRVFKVNADGHLLFSEVYEEVNGLTSVYPSRRHELKLDGWGRVLADELWHGKKDATASMAQVAITEFDYDALNRIIQKRTIEDASQSTYVEVVDTHYNDTLSEVQAIRTVTGTSGFSEKWTTKYDELGRPYEHRQSEWDASAGSFSANIRIWATDWDFLDRIVGTEDPLGVRHETGYDLRGRRDWEKRIASAGGAEQLTDYQYHATHGTLWKVIDAENAVTTFESDPSDFNRPLKTTYPDGRWEEIRLRDSFGRVTQIADSRAPLTRTFTYAFGRLVSDVAEWGSNANIVGPSKITWEYDVKDREVTSKVFTGASGSYTQVWETHRSFNEIGELVTETQGFGGDAQSWSFVSGYAGEIRRVNYPPGLGIKKGLFSYRDDGRILAAEYSDTSLIADYVFEYGGPRLVTRTDLVSGIRLESGFDGWGNTNQAKWSFDTGSGWVVLDGQVRAFDSAGHVIARKRSLDTNGEVFEHDGFGRTEAWYQEVPNALSHSPGAAPSSWLKLESYSLNDVFARTQVTKQTGGQSATTESYGSTSGAHFYNTVPDGQGGTKGRTEYEGFLSDDSDYLYRYDAWGRLAEVERKSDNVVIREYLYDASGRRVRVTNDSGNSTRFLYWGNRLAAQYDEGSNPASIRAFGYAGQGDSESLVVITGSGSANGSFDLARDFQGSILALTNRASGQVVERYRYSPFGEVAIEDASGAALTVSAYGNDRFFLGRPFDAETGLYDVRARWYDPRSGSFVTPDPLGAIDSWNMYQYGFATPGTWSDPSGLSGEGNWRNYLPDSMRGSDVEKQLEKNLGDADIKFGPGVYDDGSPAYGGLMDPLTGQIYMGGAYVGTENTPCNSVWRYMLMIELLHESFHYADFVRNGPSTNEGGSPDDIRSHVFDEVSAAIRTAAFDESIRDSIGENFGNKGDYGNNNFLEDLLDLQVYPSNRFDSGFGDALASGGNLFDAVNAGVSSAWDDGYSNTRRSDGQTYGEYLQDRANAYFERNPISF